MLGVNQTIDWILQFSIEKLELCIEIARESRWVFSLKHTDSQDAYLYISAYFYVNLNGRSAAYKYMQRHNVFIKYYSLAL